MQFLVSRLRLRHLVVMKLIALLAIGVATVSLGTHPADAADRVYTGWLSNVAVGGYDPVAYFSDGRPVEGKREFSLTYLGAEWRFSSRENMEAFRAEPARYAPQYGGHCAWAMADGDAIKGDPRHWRIVDGKLYLNYDADIQQRWEQDIGGFITRADGEWPRVVADNR